MKELVFGVMMVLIWMVVRGGWGEGEGEDEEIMVELSKIGGNIEKMGIRVRIDDGEGGGENLGEVSKGLVGVVDEKRENEVVGLDLGEELWIETGVVVCEV